MSLLLNKKYESIEQIRIDKYLSSLESPELISRSFIGKLIEDGCVKVNGKLVKKNYKLQLNDLIEIEHESEVEVNNNLEAEDIPLEIVYEDDDLAVINKPVNLVVHPGHGNKNGTLVNALLFHFGKEKLSSQGGAGRPGIVHRIDKGTSGLLIVAKNNLTHARLSDMFKERKIKKTYKAILVGWPKEEAGTIITNLERSRNNPLKMCVSHNGKESITHYKIVKYYHNFCLVDINLETGRTHQIRVHFAHLNTPVLGDRVYSNMNEVGNRIPSNYKKRLCGLYENTLFNQALHAYKLEFTHPISNKLISLEAKDPEYYTKSLAWLETNFSIDD